jgi:segregation and condensation protein B
MPETTRMEMEEIKAILEALIYVSEEPVKEAEILGVFSPELSETVQRALHELVLEYSGLPRGLRIVQVAGGFRMQTRPEHDSWIRSLYRLRNRVRLSRAALETLAIIAYRQPVTTPEIQAIRGINPMGVLQTLLERRLIRTLGRKKVVGKPILYGTTDEFLVHFGLQSLSDLPSLEDFPDLAPPAQEFHDETPLVMEGISSNGPEIRSSASHEETGLAAGEPGEDLLISPLPRDADAGPGSTDGASPGLSSDEEE